MKKPIPPKSVILYADDDLDDLQLLEDAFTNYSSNVEMVTCRNGLQALAYLKNLSPLEESPCLLILDINMPKMNGKEVLREIRSMERFRDIPVVLFSTSTHPADKEFALRYNAGFVTKPIDARQMGIIADEFIDHCAEEVKRNLKTRWLQPLVSSKRAFSHSQSG